MVGMVGIDVLLHRDILDTIYRIVHGELWSCINREYNTLILRDRNCPWTGNAIGCVMKHKHRDVFMFNYRPISSPNFRDIYWYISNYYSIQRQLCRLPDKY